MNWMDDVFKRIAESAVAPKIQAEEPKWTQDALFKALPQGAVPFGNVIPLGRPSPNAKTLADLYGQALAMAEKSVEPGSFGATTPVAPQPPEWMDEKTYLNFLNIFQQAQRDAAQKQMMEYVKNRVEGETSALKSNPLLAAAAAGAQKPLGSLYDIMRRPLDTQYLGARDKLGYNLARTGARDSSTGQLAAAGQRMAYGSSLADLYGKALGIESQLQAQDVATKLAPFTAEATISRMLTDALTRLLLGTNPAIRFTEGV